jgi:hypothetical protein
MSYKLRADQIRTINREKYRFSVNGLKWHTIDEMLEVRTGNPTQTKKKMAGFFITS